MEEQGLRQEASGRAVELDGLRGLAALAVFVSHLVGLVADAGNWAVRPSVYRLLWDGRAAVLLFFVLSGYVLTLPYLGERERGLRVAGFWLRRVTRLYPAYWCALLVALGLRWAVLGHNHLGLLNGWALSIWAEPLPWKVLVRQFLMVAPGVDTNGLDPVIWSLIVEMKASLIFPAIVWVVRRTPQWALGVLLVGGLAFAGQSPQGLATLTLMQGMQFFVLGSYLARYRVSLLGWVRGLGPAGRAVLLAAAVVLYGNAAIFGDRGRLTCALGGVGSALLILLVIELPWMARMATVGPVRLLGTVSYSFYLLHLPILLAVSNLVYVWTHSVVACGVAALAVMLVVSRGVWAVAEIPAQEWGRRWAPRLDAWVDSRLGKGNVA